jgi:hypothetical protein
MSGGELGSAAYGTSVYGSAGSQHAAPNGSIATSHPSTYSAMGGMRAMRGRRRGCRSARRGGVGMVELAVPASLAAANYYMGRRRSTGRRILPYMNMPGDMMRKTGRFIMRSPSGKSRRRMSSSRRRSGGRSMKRSRSFKRRRSGGSSCRQNN